ncbi:MAG: hypothetical protein CFE28_16005 [Alphaproteobacteria bacterium PA2]|nr:MAG: hypothetical protein CFE28_16005 [Alphaproteobacteria bacterium PA2]
MTKTSADLILDRQRLDLALTASGLGEYEWDMVEQVFRISARTAAITGWSTEPRSTADENPLFELLHPEDREANRKIITEAISRTGAFEAEYRLLRPEAEGAVWVRATGVLIRNDAGKPIAVCGFVRDISRERMIEDQRRTLMSELDHRVKNVLATVQALAQQTAKRTRSLEGFLSNFAGRLKSMAAANELLTAARWRGAAISHLAAAELGGIAPGQTRADGPELFLTPRAANALALALHELATNALKFGALSTEQGRVDLKWTETRSGGFRLTWTESGGPTVRQPEKLGFGSTLLAQVTGRELMGETHIEYRPSGVHVILTASAASVVGRPDSVPAGPKAEDTPKIDPRRMTPGDLKGRRVLIVEDAVLLALELETGLSDAGAHVIGPAYELEEALALLDQEIDAAVLDANLNGESVMPVAQALAERGVPFIFATGYGDTGAALAGFNAPIVRKPYDVGQVAQAVTDLMQDS